MEHLKKAFKEDIKNRFEKMFLRMETEEGLKQVLQWEGKTYKKNPIAKLTKFLNSKMARELREGLDKISLAENNQDGFKGSRQFVITVEWAKSRMWGSNPKASTNYGFKGESIGGCGYDKLSTATAQAINSDLFILKLLYKAKDKAIKDHKNEKNKDGTPKNNTSDLNREFLGYGSGYNVIPSFEGGVGVDCHRRIIEGLGLVWEYITSTSQTDVYLIRQKF